MKFKTLIPNVFYTDIQIGIELFVDCLGFSIRYDDLQSTKPFCVLERDGLKLQLIQDEEFAVRDRPELRLETDDIEQVYQQIAGTHPALLHPNLATVTLPPWGAKEFALLDRSHVCIVIVQW